MVVLPEPTKPVITVIGIFGVAMVVVVVVEWFRGERLFYRIEDRTWALWVYDEKSLEMVNWTDVSCIATSETLVYDCSISHQT